MDQEIEPAPFCAQCREDRIDAVEIFDVAGQDQFDTERLRKRFHALAQRLALIGKSELRALRRKRLRNAPGDRMIIGDAHDQPALALHQVLHVTPYLITCSLCSLAPLGEGWGEGALRPAYTELRRMPRQGPTPEIRVANFDLSPQRAGRG